MAGTTKGRRRVQVRDFMPEGTDRYRDLWPRILTGAGIGVVMLASALFLPDIGWAVLVSFIATMATWEFYTMTRREHRRPNELFGLVAVAALPLVAAIWGTAGMLGVLTALALLSLLWQVLFPSVTVTDSAITVFGAVYCGFMLAHLVLLRGLPDGRAYIVTLMLSVWASDIAAYFAGTAFGRHRLAPHVSPRKSWEGAVVGGFAAVVVWALSRLVIRGPISLVWLTIVGLGVAVAAIVGDLVESRIKREAGVKDSGNLLPGHGGFLDRFDAMIAAAVVAYYLLIWASR